MAETIVSRHNFPFGDALKLLKDGYLVARQGWNGKGMWLAYVHGSESKKQWHIDDGTHPACGFPTLPWIGMKTADNKFVPWFASQSDMQAQDWVIVPMDRPHEVTSP